MTEMVPENMPDNMPEKMPENIDHLTSCSLSYVLSILGGKWKPFIIWYLSLQPGHRARYGELKKIIPYKISHKMFCQHLNELKEAGILERTVVEDKPLRTDYYLTPEGISLANVLYLLRDWGVVHGDFSADALARTKGVMTCGKLEYGATSDDPQTPRERIIWRFGPLQGSPACGGCPHDPASDGEESPA